VLTNGVIALVFAGLVGAAVLFWLAARGSRRFVRQASLELTTLNELSRQLLRSELSVDGLCEAVYRQAGQIITTSFFQLGLFDGDTYRIKVWVREGRSLPPQRFPQAGNKGIVGWVRQSGQPLLVRDFEVERDRLPAFPEFESDSPAQSGLFIPLIAGTTTIGVLGIQSQRVGAFNERHLRLMTALANQAAWAIRNAQLYEKAQSRAEKLNLIGQAVARVSAIQPLPALFHQIVTLIEETFGYYCVTIFKWENGRLGLGASTHEAFSRVADEIPEDGMVGLAARQGQTVLANNVAEDPRYRRLGVLPLTRSEIALPLKVENRVLGVLDVQSAEAGAFGDEDLGLLETLAAQMALAVEQAQTYATERRLAQRLETLVEVSQALTTELELDDLFERVVELVEETFGFERVHIFILADDRLVFRAGSGSHSVRWLVDELSYAWDDPGLISKVANSGKAERIGDVTASDEYQPGPGLEDTLSEMVIPIKMAGKVFGIIDLQSTFLDAFAEDDLVLMRALADSVAVAIRNAALYAAERRRRGLAETLRDITAALISDLDLDRVLDDILDSLSRVVILDAVTILLFEPEGDRFTIAAGAGHPELASIVGQSVPMGEVASGSLPMEAAIRQTYHRLIDAPDTYSCITAPLEVGGSVIGYLIADYHQDDHYSAFDQEIVLAFANQAAAAINNARLFAAQQTEAWVTTVLLQVAEAANAQIEVEEILETIARLTALLAGVGRCMILRWDGQEEGYYIGAQYGIPTERLASLESTFIAAHDSPFLDLLAVIDDPIGAGEGHQLPIPPPFAELLTSSSILGFPLKSKGEPVGLLVVDDPFKGKALDARTEKILIGIAHQASTALETANLQVIVGERDRLEQELDVARNIQASFMPDAPPQEAGWEIATTWRAARQVGGDFFDFIPLKDGRWGLVIADVADKGIPAALFMAMCRSLLRAAAINRTSPSETLVRVNELLFSDTRSDLFVTVFYAVWDPADGEIVYASGGHNPALLLRAEEKAVERIEELKAPGIALGVLPEVDIEERQVVLLPGDVLLAYTDGVTEAMQADYTEWGLESLKETLQSAAPASASALAEQVLQTIDEFVGDAPQSDDLTLWLIRRVPEEVDP
jgi:sigma-B regulation protein RsbU (phosphoserine phosphatase)